jgi:hypothetical protein
MKRDIDLQFESTLHQWVMICINETVESDCIPGGPGPHLTQQVLAQPVMYVCAGEHLHFFFTGVSQGNGIETDLQPR